MYVDPLTIYREYIQNAADAIDEARRHGSFSALMRWVTLTYTSTLLEGAIRIRDNGASIPRGQFIQRLLAIGMSNKRGKGFVAFAASVDCRAWLLPGTRIPGPNDAREPVTRNYLEREEAKRPSKLRMASHDLQSAITEIATVNRSSGGTWPARFFEVELRKVLRIKNDILLNADAVHEYLSQVGPVQFRQAFDYSNSIKEFLNRHGTGEVIELVINGNITVQRPHETDFASSPKLDDRFSGIKCLRNSGLDGLDTIGWVLHHRYLGALPRELNVSGLRVRAGNIQVGGNDIFADYYFRAAI